MTNEIRESLSRLGQVLVSDLKGTGAELQTLIAAIRKEVEARGEAMKTAGSGDPIYLSAGNDLVELLQLNQAAVAANAEIDRLVLAAGKAVSRVLKKTPK
mgnify:CR=1 FL=1